MTKPRTGWARLRDGGEQDEMWYSIARVIKCADHFLKGNYRKVVEEIQLVAVAATG